MAQITIDSEKCSTCGTCARACGRYILRQKAKRAPIQICDEEACFNCGQCLAVCPRDAITHSELPQGSVFPINKERLPDYDTLLELLRTRRSRRSFTGEPVELEKIKKLLEAARFAPSGHNEQTTEYVVITDKKAVKDVGDLTAKGLRKLTHNTKNPIGRMFMRLFMGKRSAASVIAIAPELDGLVDMYEQGTEDLILRGAPAVILFCADDAGGFGGENANLALHNAALAAETLGLGCFYAGFITIAAGRDDGVAQRVGLPKTHKIYGALALGNTSLKYRKWPQRKEAKVTWISE